MRLIDADALGHELVVEMVKCVIMSEETKGSMAERVLNILDEAPTIEAEPVKHGRWEETVISYHDTHYCPNCGCKMDLEGEG